MGLRSQRHIPRITPHFHYFSTKIWDFGNGDFLEVASVLQCARAFEVARLVQDTIDVEI